MENKMLTLSGSWSIVKDAENLGKEKQWNSAPPADGVESIHIPEYIPNSKWTLALSYAHVFPKYHGYVWYYKKLETLPLMEEDERLLVEFERAGYFCEVFFNGVCLGTHCHQEEAFSFDVTDFVRPDGENLLAVRCFEPRSTGEEIDGIKLQKIPNSCAGRVKGFAFGCPDEFCLECVGGILGAVHLRAVPGTRIQDLYVRAMYKTGEVQITVSLWNAGASPETREIQVVLSDKKSGVAVQTVRQTVTAPAGASEITLCTRIENYQLWELDSPVLYLAAASVDGRDLHTVRFGFKDFRIQNGFFFLNGKRILAKGGHCVIVPAYAYVMKTLGFNMIRTIARAFTKELLDICDEIGLLVMDAAATAWGMSYHEQTKAQMEEFNEALIRGARNHPCVAAYCLFNEERDCPELCACGVKVLPKLRALAPDTLFMIHSGRWDCDITVGSASNPGSDKWDTYLGAEGIEDYPHRHLPFPCDGYHDPAMGDIHVYMVVPVASQEKEYMRKIGAGLRPIFVSETGIASQSDPMGKYLKYSREKLAEIFPIAFMKQSWQESEKFLDFYDLRDVYPNLSDFSRDTERLNGVQRQLLFNIFRGNPMINGIFYTSIGVGHEGIYRGDLVIKDSLAYAIQQGNAPLRWSLFTSERTVYANKPFAIEAVLCNEDVLPPGNYRAQAYIRGADGCVWKKGFTVNYPKDGYGDMPPLAYSALRETVSLPAGDYTLTARLLEGGDAYDENWGFTVAEASGNVEARAAVYGLPENVMDFLKAHGVSTLDLREVNPTDPPPMVLVGDPETFDCEDILTQLAENGCNVVFLDSAFFEENDCMLKKIAGENANVRCAVGTIYHHDYVNITHPVFDSIKRAGVLEFDKFGMAYPNTIYYSVNKPTKTVCAALRIDTSHTTPGLSYGEYACGKGRYVLNSFRLCESVGKHPYADLLLLNTVRYYG